MEKMKEGECCGNDGHLDGYGSCLHPLRFIHRAKQPSGGSGDEGSDGGGGTMPIHGGDFMPLDGRHGSDAPLWAFHKAFSSHGSGAESALSGVCR